MSKPLLSGLPTGNAAIEAEIPYLDTKQQLVTLSYEQRSSEALSIVRPRVKLRNGRATPEPPSLDRQGFQLVHSPSRVALEQLAGLIEDNRLPSDLVGPVNLAYLAELEPLILRLSEGAREVFAQYGTITIRFSARATQRSWMTTAQFAHLDFESTEVERLLKDTLELTGRKIEPFQRQVMLQAWRVITPPPQDNTLALCDQRTVSQADIVTFDYLGVKGSRNERIRSRACRYNPHHEWYYFPNLTPDEVIVFKGYDSAAPENINAMHTAFEVEGIADAIPRGSIECRFIVLYD